MSRDARGLQQGVHPFFSNSIFAVLGHRNSAENVAVEFLAINFMSLSINPYYCLVCSYISVLWEMLNNLCLERKSECLNFLPGKRPSVVPTEILGPLREPQLGGPVRRHTPGAAGRQPGDLSTPHCIE